MIKILVEIIQRLESFEKNYSRVFWLCTSLLRVFTFDEFFQKPNQQRVTIEKIAKIRGGVEYSKKIKNFDKNFHLHLEEAFPDWQQRVEYQEKQSKFYKSANKKKLEIKN
jgi:small nuclear ribonucleoprotein (snRNP)-like protein